MPNPQLPSTEPHAERGDNIRQLAEAPVVAASERHRLKIPQQIGKYAVVGKLGSGGAGTVYLAEDETLTRQVAIKILWKGSARRTVVNDVPVGLQSGIDPLFREAAKVAKLTHPGIVQVFDHGWCEIEDEIGPCAATYVVYQRIEGATLDRWLEIERPNFVKIARLFIAIAQALEYLHRQQVFHRDIKPGNIIVQPDGAPVLIDFGLALTMREDIEPMVGMISGTPHYMSPDQVRGEPHNIDGRTDIYSLGATLYETLTGHLPFPRELRTASDKLALFQEILHRVPQPPRQLNAVIPENLSELCEKMLAKSFGDRYATAADVIRDLRLFLGERESPLAGSSGYLLIVQTHDGSWAQTQQRMTENHFCKLTPSIPEIGTGPVLKISPAAGLDGAQWRTLLAETLKTIRLCQAEQICVHLVPRVKTLCAYALGSLMNHQHDSVIYHVQNGRLYRICEMDRAVTNLRSPRPGVAQPYEFFSFDDDADQGDSRASSECLVFHVGANDTRNDVQRWCELLPERPKIRCFAKAFAELSPDAPQRWIQAAAEMSNAIKNSQAADIYLITDAPAALVLMAGDALGPWAGRRVHLMQFDDKWQINRRESPYVEVLVLPDAQLDEMIARH